MWCPASGSAAGARNKFSQEGLARCPLRTSTPSRRRPHLKGKKEEEKDDEEEEEQKALEKKADEGKKEEEEEDKVMDKEGEKTEGAEGKKESDEEETEHTTHTCVVDGVDGDTKEGDGQLPGHSLREVIHVELHRERLCAL